MGGDFRHTVLLVGAALQIWALTDSDLRERLIVYTAILVVGASPLCTLGRACHQLARLEDRVLELERQREPAYLSAGNGGKG